METIQATVPAVKAPTVGRMVHYFPRKDEPNTTFNGTTLLPAYVVQEWGNLVVNLSVLTVDQAAPTIVKFSVPHKSTAAEGQSYWDWPEIK